MYKRWTPYCKRWRWLSKIDCGMDKWVRRGGIADCTSFLIYSLLMWLNFLSSLKTSNKLFTIQCKSLYNDIKHSNKATFTVYSLKYFPCFLHVISIWIENIYKREQNIFPIKYIFCLTLQFCNKNWIKKSCKFSNNPMLSY